jgi:hypothetical protein
MTKVTPATDLSEDLLDLAEFEFHAAQEGCVDCKEYHALWGYGRLAGLNDGLSTDADVVAPLLAKFAPRGARILIAGAADAGLLALTAQSTRHADPQITVADRCATPLAVCRHYAQAHGLAIETIIADLTRTSPKGPFHLVIMHNLLLFIPAAQRVPLLRLTAHSLAKNGMLLLVNRMPRRQFEGITPKYRDNSKLAEVLAQRQIALPEGADKFAERIMRLAAFEESRERALDCQQIQADLKGANFGIVEQIEHLRRRAFPAREGVEIVPTYTFIASHRG